MNELPGFQIGDHQQIWESMRKIPGEGRGHTLLVIADLINSIHKWPALFSFRSMRRDHPVTVEPFQFSSR